MQVTELTPRLKQVSEFEASHTRHVFIFDGVEVLHACKVYSYDAPAPYYSRVNSCGEYRPQLTKEQFNAELNRLKQMI